MNILHRGLMQSAGISTIGNVRNRAKSQTIHYCYARYNNTSSSLFLVLIDNKTNQVLSVGTTDFRVNPTYNSGQFYNEGKFYTLGCPHTNSEIRYFSPLARLRVISEIAYNHPKQQLTVTQLKQMKKPFAHTGVPVIMENVYISVFDQLRFLVPNATDLDAMHAMLDLVYCINRESLGYTLKRANPIKEYYNLLGMVFKRMVMHGYSSDHYDAIDLLISSHDAGKIFNLFLCERGTTVAPIDTVASWKSPLTEAIRYDNTRSRVQLSSYAKVPDLLGLLHNPFLK